MRRCSVLTMTDERRPSLAVRPSPDQIARFALLTPEQRFYWLVDTIALCFDLATPEARQSWRNHKHGE